MQLHPALRPRRRRRRTPLLLLRSCPPPGPAHLAPMRLQLPRALVQPLVVLAQEQVQVRALPLSLDRRRRRRRTSLVRDVACCLPSAPPFCGSIGRPCWDSDLLVARRLLLVP